MAHVNTQLREAVADALKTVEAFRTVASSQADLVDAELPAAVPVTATDSVEPWSKGPPREELRTVALAVVIVAEGDPETLEADLDVHRAVVEPLILTAVSSIARDVRHTGGEIELGADEEGERWVGFLALSWDVEIVTAVGDPETALL